MQKTLPGGIITTLCRNFGGKEGGRGGGGYFRRGRISGTLRYMKIDDAGDYENVAIKYH